MDHYLGDPDGKISIKINLKEIWYERVDWIHLAQDWDEWRALRTR